MPVYKKHRLIHIHIPKTGGTAIERQFHEIGDMVWGKESWLGEEYRDGRWYEYQHLTSTELRSLSNGEFNDFETFAVVRDPYQRLVSDYLWRVRIKESYPDAAVSSYSSFEAFIRSIPSDLDQNWSCHIRDADKSETNLLIHTRPQSHFVSNAGTLDSSIQLVRFEDLKNQLEQLFETWHIENRVIRSPQPHDLREFYTDETLDIVSTIYSDDFAWFSYPKRTSLGL